MIISFEFEDRIYKIDAEKPLSIAIPLNFNGEQPNAYRVEKATSKPCEAGEMIGDTRRGGSVNFEQYKFIPHCNGTHTECVGHITHKRISVNECLKDAFVPAVLISVLPEKKSETDENYSVELNENDLLITKKSIQKALENLKSQISNFKSEEKNEDQRPKIKDQRSKIKSLIIRTLPNSSEKLSKTYLEEVPPFFSIEAMEFINEIGVNHLICDLPSIDRIFDEGKLFNHRIFWNVEQGSFETKKETFINKTITELAFISDEIKDGEYLLNLQIAPFNSDASPSRPIIFKVI